MRNVALYFLMILLFAGCSIKPYLKSNAFSGLGIEPQEENSCIAMLKEDKVDYLLCEPENRAYKIKIIPADHNSGVIQILHEQNNASDSFASVIQKDILQVSIPIYYSFQPAEGIKALKRGEKIFLVIKSVESEKLFIDGIFILNKYYNMSVGKRDSLR